MRGAGRVGATTGDAAGVAGVTPEDSAVVGKAWASAHGLVGSANKSAYVASKHALVGLTKVVALENAKNGITCNAICPGWVYTPLVEAQIQKKATEQGISVEHAKSNLLEEKQPSGQFATAADVGEFVKFLCSSAAAQINGATLSIDGGWVAQ